MFRLPIPINRWEAHVPDDLWGRRVRLAASSARLVRVACVALAALPSPAAAQERAGLEFAASGYTTGHQLSPAVAADVNGDFVVTWVRHSVSFTNSEVFARRFDAQGVPKEAEFQVNLHTTGSQTRPAIAGGDLGNFVVVWESEGQDGSGFGIFARVFDSNGAPQGGEIPVSSYTTGLQIRPSVAMDAGDNFVVTWYGDGPGGFASWVRRFDATGTPLFPEVPASAFTTGGQPFPDVATDAIGDFVVVWRSYVPSGIRARRFDALGAAKGPDFEVRSHLTGSTVFPDVDMESDGRFTVVWTKNSGEPSGGPGAFGRRFDASGAAEGPQFQINTYTNIWGVGWEPEVALDARGDFVVAWWSYGPAEHLRGVFGRRFDASASPRSDAFGVNTYTTEHQHVPSVASNPDGDFVVAWTSRQFGGLDNIFLQRYGDLIFQDGFEAERPLALVGRTDTTASTSMPRAAARPWAGRPSACRRSSTTPRRLYVQDDTPNAEDRYRVRFYFDPNGFDPGEAAGNLPRARSSSRFNGASAAPGHAGASPPSAANTAIMARVRRDDGTREDTGFFPIADAPHLVEFDWLRASSPGANDGQFVLRLDDAVVSTLFGIDNDDSPMEFARLGVMTIKTPLAAGTVYFDQFESRRRRYIGPEHAANTFVGP